MSQTIKKTNTILAGLLTVCGLAFAGGAPAAHATAGSCIHDGVVNTPDFGYKNKYWCNNRANAPVYSGVVTWSPYHGYMHSTHSWFVCQYQGGANPVTTNSNGTRNTNVWWLYTEADTKVQADGSRWGFMPATYVNQGTNNKPVPGVPECPSSV